MSPFQASLAVVLRYRWLILLTMGVTIASAIVFTFQIMPLYIATATIHIQQQNRELEGHFGESPDMQQEQLNTEIEVLKSRTLAEAAVQRLGYQLQPVRPFNGWVALYRRIVGQMVSMYNGLATVLSWVTNVSTLPPPSFSQPPVIFFRDVKVGDVTTPALYTIRFMSEGQFVVEAAEDGREIGRGQNGVPFHTDVISFVLETQGAKAGKEVAFELLPLPNAAEQFRGQVAISLVKGSEIVTCSAENATPRLARDMASALAQEYIAFTQRQKSDEALQALNFIDQQLQSRRELLLDSEKALSRYKEDQKFVALGSEEMASLNKLTQTEMKLRGFEGSIQSAADLLGRLQGKGEALNGDALYKLGSSLGSPLLESLAKRLTDLQVSRETLRIKYGSKHPRMAEVTKQIGSVKREMLSELTALTASFRSQEGSLSQLMQTYQGHLAELPEAERELATLVRQTRSNEDLYRFLLKKQEEIKVVKGSTLGHAQVLDLPLIPKLPVKPDKKKAVVIAILLGSMLGIGTAFLMDHFDSSLKTIEEAKQQIGVPLLGTIPEVRSGRGKGAITERAAAAENYRSLRTNFRLVAEANRNAKTLAVVSPQSGDGKSTVATNLALSLGMLGYKTLLIDADLRKPTLNRYFTVMRMPGLVEILRGEKPWHEVLHKLEDKLHLIPAGIPSPSTSELLDSQLMKELISIWRENYDYVVIDAPAMLALTDALVVGTLCDGALLVLRAGSTPANAVQQAKELLNSAQIPILGMVMNGLKLTREYSYYYYDYRPANARHVSLQQSRKSASAPPALYTSSLDDFPRLANRNAVQQNTFREAPGWEKFRRLIPFGLVAGLVIGLVYVIGQAPRNETEREARGSTTPSKPPELSAAVHAPTLDTEAPREPSDDNELLHFLQADAQTVELEPTDEMTTASPSVIDIHGPLPEYKVIIVQPGDSLWRIMRREYNQPGPSLAALIESINPDLRDSSQLKVGQRITLPVLPK